MRVLIVLLMLVQCASAQFSLRFAMYNLLNYNGSDRNEYFAKIMDEIHPDVLVVQEILSQTAVDVFAEDVLKNAYHTIEFHNGPDTDNHIFYNPFEFIFNDANYLSTALRDIAEYEIKIPSTNDIIYVYSVHLKASDTPDDQQKRLAEATILRDHLNQHEPNTNFMVVGDFNLYSSSEPAYVKLTGSEQDDDGRLFDPINRPGGWHNSSSFADIHTQSSRTDQFGGGATGGLDDRFDLFLVSAAMLDEVQPQTYTAFGNDAGHFNLSINFGTNFAVSADIADALHAASDHLPVYVDFVFGATGIGDEQADVLPAGYELHQNYPNPFNSTTAISYSLLASGDVDLSIYDVQGRKLFTLVNDEQQAGDHVVYWDAGEFRSGVYYARLTVTGQGPEAGSPIRKMVCIK